MSSSAYCFHGFHLDPASRELWRGKEEVTLQLKVFDCILYLIEHRDRAVGRNELIDAVWGEDVHLSDSVLGKNIRLARRAFDDVPFDNTFCPWIQELAGRGIVSGCGGGNYCPGAQVTRAQMAIFLLKTLEGAEYTPPTCTDVFDDVPCPSLFADWIEELAAREITGGCSETEYCPGNPVTRGQMAVFVTRTFGLTLYGP